MKHPLVNRTSPMGTPFVGTCASCGKEGITFDMMFDEDCANPKGMTNEEAVLKALDTDENS